MPEVHVPAQKKRSRKRKSRVRIAKRATNNGGLPPGVLPIRRARTFSAASARGAMRAAPPGLEKARTALLANSRGQDFELIGLALAMPTANRPVRWSSEFSSKETAVAAPWSQLDVPWARGVAVASSNGDFGFTATDAYIAVFRCAQRAAVIFDPNPTGEEYTYGLFGKSTILVDDAPTNSMSIVVPNREYVAIDTAFARPGTAYRPHGDTLFAGDDGDTRGRYYWMNSGVQVSLFITVGTTGFITFSLNRWYDDLVSVGVQSVRAACVANTPVEIDITLDSYGYFAPWIYAEPTVVVADVSCTNVAILFTGDQEVMCHLPIKDYVTNVASINGIRINAVSVMYTNLAPILSRQGEIAALQAPVEKQWTDYATGGFTSVSSANGGSRSRDITNGMYTFLKPESTLDFEFQSYDDTSLGSVVDSHYPLKNPSSYLVMRAKVNNTAEAQAGKYTISHGIEFLTDDVFREVSTSTLDRRLFSDALDFLKQLEQFHENPLHFADVVRKIEQGVRGAIKGIQRYGPTVLNGIARYGPQALQFASAFA